MPDRPFAQQDKLMVDLKDYLSNRGIMPGDRLPSERVLCEDLDAPRAKIREVLLKLSFLGVVELVPRKGYIVSQPGKAGFGQILKEFLTVQDLDYVSLLELRSVLEIEACKLAAVRRTDSQLERILEIYSRHDKKTKNGIVDVDGNIEFHLAIAEASDNKIISGLIGAILPDVQHFPFMRINDVTKARLKSVAIEHKSIVDAIVSQDEEAASTAMTEHMARTKTIATKLKDLYSDL